MDRKMSLADNQEEAKAIIADINKMIEFFENSKDEIVSEAGKEILKAAGQSAIPALKEMKAQIAVEAQLI